MVLCVSELWQFRTLIGFVVVKQGLILDKSTHLSELDVRVIGDIYVIKKWRDENRQPGSDFHNFKPWHETCIFECISLLKGSLLGGVDPVFWQGKSRFIKRHQFLPLTRQLFFCIHIYSLWFHDFITVRTQHGKNHSLDSCWLLRRRSEPRRLSCCSY